MSEPRRNRLLMAAWILTLLAFLGNFLFFWQFVGEWMLPWLILVLFAAALMLCVAALRRAFGQPGLYRGKVSGSIVTVLACLMFAVTIFVFYLARHIPEASQAPRAGQQAPEFNLADTSGVQVSLSSLLNAPMANASGADGKPKAVLLVFYRGYWLPFCNLELRGIEKRLDEFSKAGVRPVAISVDTPQQSADLRQKAGYTFPILSDPKAETIRRYHLLHTGGGPENSDISRPAEFLVDSTGIIRWANFTEDFRVRARANEMLAAAREIR